MNGALCWDCNVIYLFTVQNCGLKKSADYAQWRTLGSWNTNFYAEITSCRQTSWHLKGYAWTDWQCHVAWTRLDIPGQAVRLLAAIIRNSRHKPRGRRWNFEEKLWLCLYLSVAQNHIFFFSHYSLFHQDAPCNPSSILFILGPASIPMFFMHFVTLCRKCLKKSGTVVSYIMKCRSERMFGLIRSLIV
jgi:hypothetical protein